MLGSPDDAVLHGMNHLQAHRGPDGSFIWLDDDCGLAHARLSIVDLQGSYQPICSDFGTTLVINGEIYNHHQLRSHYPHYPWRTSGDSESVLALFTDIPPFSDFGNPAARHTRWARRLDGMFALAIWDAKNRELVLARDPLGIKPLVRTKVDGSLLFSSEVKALRAHEGHIPEMDEMAMIARLAWEYPLDGTTLFKGVTQVRPGTVETWSIDERGNAVQTGVATFQTNILSPTETWDVESGSEELLESFVTSVSDRLMSDVPLGIVLSGGLDSSLVAAVADEAAERAGQPVPACWTVAESEDNPDWQAAELVASSLDLEHHQHVLEDDAFHGSLADLAWHGEDLDVTVLFFQPLFAKMAESVTVGLCGQGADELHAGYPRYRDPAANAAMVRARLEAIQHPGAQPLLNAQMERGDAWWTTDLRPETHTTSLQKMLQFEMEHGQLTNFQLRLVDRHSMAAGLEIRVPFLGATHRSVSNRLPMQWRLPDSGEEKAALRKAAQLTKLPDEIIRRPKMPAGKATSPTMLQELLDELAPRAKEILSRYSVVAGALKGQPEIAVGLGLFESLHLVDRGVGRHGKSLVDLLDEVC